MSPWKDEQQQDRINRVKAALKDIERMRAASEDSALRMTLAETEEKLTTTLGFLIDGKK